MSQVKKFHKVESVFQRSWQGPEMPQRQASIDLSKCPSMSGPCLKLEGSKKQKQMQCPVPPPILWRKQPPLLPPQCFGSLVKRGQLRLSPRLPTPGLLTRTT